MKYVPVILYILAFIFAYFVQNLTTSFYSALFFGVLLFSVGIQGIWSWIGHCFFSEAFARQLGWTKSPFQHEVGYANLGFGITAILAFFWPIFAPGVAIGVTIFMLGCAWGHLHTMIKTKKFSVGHAGQFFIADIVIPATLIICLLNLITIAKA